MQKISKISQITIALLLMTLAINCEKCEPLKISKVTIGSVIEFDETTATLSGEVVDVGEGATEYGHCWSTSSIPTVNDLKKPKGGTVVKGTYSTTITGLSPESKYYVRAYILEGDKPVYSDEEVSFTTKTITPQTPVVTTGLIGNVAYNTASCGGEVTSQGTQPVTAKGVCWCTSQNPTIDSCLGKTDHGTGTGRFTSEITGLSSNNTYYVRAYATNSVGTSYGDQSQFLTARPPVVTIGTFTPDYIYAEGSASVTDVGSKGISGWGVCWNTSGSPTFDENKIPADNLDVLSQDYTLIDLEIGTTYHIRAYAINDLGVIYSNPVTIITKSTVEDYSGNSYPVIKIGLQIWMKENLKTQKYNDGKSITYPGEDYIAWQNNTTGAYAWYNHDMNNKDSYGALYNWYAVNAGKLCPIGWHVPTDVNWKYLIDNIGGSSVAGGKLKETGITHWESPNSGATNESNFAALPGGERDITDKLYFREIGRYGFYWSSTYSAPFAFHLELSYDQGSSRLPGDDRNKGFSVRCLKD